MKQYIASIDGKISATAYTSLRQICQENGVSYASASRGKRLFEVDGKVVVITEIMLQKIIGRGGHRTKKAG